MNETQEVKVLSRAGCSDRSEPQSAGPRGRREGSGEQIRGLMNKNRIRGDDDRGEWPSDHEAPATKDRRRKSGGRAEKRIVLTSGDLALRLKGRRDSRRARSEKSADVIVARTEAGSGESPRKSEAFGRAKDGTRRRAESP